MTDNKIVSTHNTVMSELVPLTCRETRNGLEQLSLPTELLRTRKVFLVGEVDADSMENLLQSLMYLESESDDPIELYINSPGGEVTSGIAVYRYMTEQMRSEIHTYCIGRAASMGAVLYLAGSKRFIYEGTEIMIHDPASVSGTFEKPEQLRDRLENLEKTKLMTCRIIAERTGHDIDEISEITKKDSFFDAQEAVSFGLATDIVKGGDK